MDLGFSEWLSHMASRIPIHDTLLRVLEFRVIIGYGNPIGLEFRVIISYRNPKP